MNRIDDYITVSTPQGEVKAKIIISYEERDDKEPGVELELYYNNKVYHSATYDYLWIKTFADLQKQLPGDAIIKCCLTCRYGNLCPVGNCPNEVFCTKDIVINKKSDLFFYTENDHERETRSRKYCFICNDFERQNDNFYTYNDYLYYLKQYK